MHHGVAGSRPSVINRSEESKCRPDSPVTPRAERRPIVRSIRRWTAELSSAIHSPQGFSTTKPASLTFAPVDFERQSLAEGLRAGGFQADRPAFFQWLGVVPYLTREAVSLTLDFIAGVPESEVVFDYAEPLENYPDDRRADV